MAGALYLDSSVVLRATLEAGSSPDLERKLRDAEVVITSRLSFVESARAIHRVRRLGDISEKRLADLQREIDTTLARCEVWELSQKICASAAELGPAKPLRALDALHLATFLAARKRFEGLELLTADERLRDAALG